MKTTRKCSHNTTMKYIKMFKVITNYAVKNDWLDKDPFKLFECKIEKIERDHLTKEEIQAIRDKEFVSERLDNVRNIFVFSIFTGLAYVDVANLTKSNIVTGVDGKLWLSMARAKTKVMSPIPLLPSAIKVLEKYKDHPICEIKGTLLPVPTNQKLNEYLKEIADLCGIEKRVSFHMARHTFATVSCLANGVTLENVAKMLGHSNTKMTQQYAKVLDRSIMRDMKKVESRLRK